MNNLQEENELETLSEDTDLGKRSREVVKLVLSPVLRPKSRKELQLSSDDGEVVSPVTVAVAVTTDERAALAAAACCCWR